MSDQNQVLSVSRLVSLLKETVEDNFVQVAVEAEISNLARPASGHLYFTLKDDSAQLRAVLFKPSARLLKFDPESGLQVICRGHVTLYPQRGDVQMVVEAMEPVGAGSLQLAFEQLKARLAAEGLFAASRKHEIPSYPQTVGVVTSASGAAIHDILRVLRRQAGGLEVLIWPVRVQGDAAASEIAVAIEELDRRENIDVLIVGRGGGSLEDLWAFNEEIVARAIAASHTPIISAVGHEVDFTIADFVADLRAATPTSAAELAVKGRLELEAHLDQLKFRLACQVESRLDLLKERIFGLRRRLVSPERQIEIWRHRFEELVGRLSRSGKYILEQKSSGIATLAARLDLLSPLKTLERGYSIVKKADGCVVRRSAQVSTGESLLVKFARGEARVKVEETGN
ncbi:MAG: exodeoxyribonuclease VII large subunit [Desulfuromonas sp.]|nr:MAG: exodeoxyribonuclease VII large subunit [Desulfuromonas sp.]